MGQLRNDSRSLRLFIERTTYPSPLPFSSSYAAIAAAITAVISSSLILPEVSIAGTGAAGTAGAAFGTSVKTFSFDAPILFTYLNSEIIKDRNTNIKNTIQMPIKVFRPACFIRTLDEIGAYKEIISTEVEVSEDGKSADVRIKAAFEQYDATISAKCYYTVTNATGYDDLWSSFNVDIDYPMSVLISSSVS